MPFRFFEFRKEVSLFVEWYNGDRPHTALSARTPDEVFFGRRPAATKPRFESRARWPRGAVCAAPLARVRGKPGVDVEIDVQFRSGRNHLPVVTLRRAA
jgi:hypothetical protein